MLATFVRFFAQKVPILRSPLVLLVRILSLGFSKEDLSLNPNAFNIPQLFSAFEESPVVLRTP
jgi:hypothetical protein